MWWICRSQMGYVSLCHFLGCFFLSKTFKGYFASLLFPAQRLVIATHCPWKAQRHFRNDRTKIARWWGGIGTAQRRGGRMYFSVIARKCARNWTRWTRLILVLPLVVTTRDGTRHKTRSDETKCETLCNRFRGETKREAREEEKAKASTTIFAHSLGWMCSEHCKGVLINDHDVQC